MENLLNEKIASPPGLAKLALDQDVKNLQIQVNKNTEDIANIDISIDNSIIEGLQMQITENKKDIITNSRAIDNLSYETTVLSGEVDAVKKSVSDGKKKVADAITVKGVQTAADSTFDNMANNILNIQSGDLGIDTSDGTITPEDVIQGEIGYSQDNRIVGTMPKIASQNYSLPINGTYTIPKGYHDGTGKVTQAVTNRGAVNATLAINGTYTIPEGYHNGNGKVTQSISTKGAATYTPTTYDQTISAGYYLSGTQTIKGSSNLKAANIAKNVNIFGVIGTLQSWDRYLGSYLKWVEPGYLTLLNSSSFTIPYSGKICFYEFVMNYNNPDDGFSHQESLCWASPGFYNTFNSYERSAPYVCPDMYSHNFSSYVDSMNVKYGIYPPNVNVTNNGRTINWTWPKGKSSRITSLGIFYAYIAD